MLLTTLVGLMLLASMVVTLQVRTQATLTLLARLESRHVDAMAEAAIRARLAERLAERRDGRGPGPALDGTVRQEVFAGRIYNVRLTDVEGLIDLYLAPEEVLALLPLPAAQVEAMRNAALATLPAGERFLTKDQTLVRYGFDRQSRQIIAPWVTQSAQTGQINPAFSPEPIRTAANLIDARDVAGGVTAEIAVWRPAQP